MKNLLLAFVFLFVTSSVFADTTLLATSPRTKLTAKQQKLFDRNKNHKATVAIQVAKLNIKDVLGGNGVLAFPVIIELNAKTKIKMENCEIEDDKKYLRVLWQDNGNSVTMTINKANNLATAYIIFDNKVYVVEPLGDGLVIIMQIDQTKFPNDKNDTKSPPYLP